MKEDATKRLEDVLDCAALDDAFLDRELVRRWTLSPSLFLHTIGRLREERVVDAE